MTENKSAECSCCGPACCSAENASGPKIRTTTGMITVADRLDHVLARWGVNRMGHRVEPGLYKLGNPTPDSEVFASANYTLSFDALRSALNGRNAWILVLDTKGINVWCAAGKGTFGTDELIRRIESTGLAGVIRHRKIILPQLGAPGVAWPEVVRKSGFIVEYGPVRASDLPAYLTTHSATAEMRKVRFTLRDRLVLIPVELVHVLVPAIASAILLFFLAGPTSSLAAITAVLAGTVFFPALLPFIPTRDFSTKGFILGMIVAFPFAFSFSTEPVIPLWAKILAGTVPLLIIPAVTAYLALNFTGSTTSTSRTGVKKEIFRYIPVMALMAGSGIAIGILLGASRFMGLI